MIACDACCVSTVALCRLDRGGLLHGIAVIQAGLQKQNPNWGNGGRKVDSGGHVGNSHAVVYIELSLLPLYTTPTDVVVRLFLQYDVCVLAAGKLTYQRCPLLNSERQDGRCWGPDRRML